MKVLRRQEKTAALFNRDICEVGKGNNKIMYILVVEILLILVAVAYVILAPDHKSLIERANRMGRMGAYCLIASFVMCIVLAMYGLF